MPSDSVSVSPHRRRFERRDEGKFLLMLKAAHAMGWPMRKLADELGVTEAAVYGRRRRLAKMVEVPPLPSGC